MLYYATFVLYGYRMSVQFKTEHAVVNNVASVQRKAHVQLSQFYFSEHLHMHEKWSAIAS